jgi:hypothetical protein
MAGTPREMLGGARQMVGNPPGTLGRREPSPSQLRDGRRLLALFGGAALVMLVVGIASGRTTSPLPAGSTTSQSAGQAGAQHSQAGQSQSQSQAHSSTAPGAITLGPSAQASQAPAAATPQLSGLKVLGDGGTGYQVRDFRYGIHPNDFRMVLDMDASGSASGTPKVQIGFQDSTTLLIVLTGVVPAGSTGQLPSNNPVVSVTQVTPSPYAGAITYQVKLAHAVTFSAVYATSPLRLVIDLAS